MLIVIRPIFYEYRKKFGHTFNTFSFFLQKEEIVKLIFEICGKI